MNARWFALAAASIAILTASPAAADGGRSAYSYVRDSSGQVLVISPSNGEVQARRNLPISAGDEMKTEDPARAEIALADGNILHVGGGTRVRFASISSQQGSDDEVSAIDLSDGSVILSAVSADERSVPRVDTADASVYANAGARVRVNTDVRRGTVVVVRAGSVEVRTRSGSYTVRAGNYLLVQGDEEPEIARGTFSRDRFDLWAADRMAITYDAPRSASSRYVGDEYAGDVQALDGYGDWDYSATHSTYVWRPQVAVGWTPYSYGSWYYTPVGLTWWSWDTWGWYPFHYGNWFFDAGWNSWCWAPGYVYSPAWVYWAYTPSYFGWCPVGYYGFYSPWWNTYYRNLGWGRNSVAFAINGRFSTRTVDFRGWNFTGVSNLGTRGRLDVVPGTRVVERLGSDVAISSRPIVLSERGQGTTREALRDYVREAPRVIERTTSPRDSQRLAPVLARERTLPPSTVEALRERTVVAERGRLTGPGASELAPRGTAVVERGRAPLEVDARRGGTPERFQSGRTVERPSESLPSERGRTVEAPERGSRSDGGRPTRPESQDSWRGQAPQARPSEASPPQVERPVAEDWRGRPAPRSSTAERSAPARSQSYDRGGQQDWRARSEVPPARRVVEGSVPGRRPADTDSYDASRHRGHDANAPSRSAAPRDYSPRDYAPRGRDSYTPPARQAPAPRDSGPRSIERSAPRSAPAREAAPAPRSAPAPSGPPPSSRSAPAPSSSGHRGRP